MAVKKKKKEENKWKHHVIYNYVVEQIKKGHDFIDIDEDFFRDRYLDYNVTYQDIKPTVKELRKQGRKVEVEKYKLPIFDVIQWTLSIDRWQPAMD